MMIGLIDIGSGSKLKLASVDVSCSIQNLLVSCFANLVYKNDVNKDAEGLFLFPLKCHYDVKGIDVDVNGRILTGQYTESSEAKKLSPMFPENNTKDIVIGSDIKIKDSFKFRVGHIPRGSDVKITLRFLIELKLDPNNNSRVDRDQFSLVLPSILKPCCNRLGKDNTADLYYVGNQYTYRFNADFNGTKTIKEIHSSNYVLNTNISGDKNCNASVKLVSQYVGKNDLDIKVYYAKENGPSVLYQNGSTSSFNQTDFRRDDVAVLNFISDVELKKLEFVLLVDMSDTGFDIDSTKQCIDTFLANLPYRSRFQIYIMGSNSKKFFPVPQLYDNKSVNLMEDLYDNLKSDSKIADIIESLKDMYNSPLTEDYIRIAFLVTKGCTNINEFLIVPKKNTVLHKISMGNHISSVSSKDVGAGGPFIIVKDMPEVSSRISDICEKTLKANQCAIDNIRWECPDGVSVEMVLGDQDYVHTNNFISAFCIIKGLKEISKIKGEISVTMHGKSEKYPIELEKNIGVFDNEFSVHQLMAKFKLKEMMLEIENGNERMKISLIQLSVEANIKTSYTTFVAVDKMLPNRGLFVSDFMDPSQCYKPVVLKTQTINTVVIRPVIRQENNSGFFRWIKQLITGDKETEGGSTTISKEIVDYDETPMKIYINDDSGSWNRRDKLSSIAEMQKNDGSFSFEDELIWSVGLDPQSVEKTHPDFLSIEMWMTTLVRNFLNTKLKNRKSEWQLLEEKAKKMIVQNLIESNKFGKKSPDDIDIKAVQKWFQQVTSEALLILKEEDNGLSEISPQAIVDCTKETRPFEIVFVVDRSGSMSGSKIECAKDCLLIFISSIPMNCKFQIYGFGSSFDKVFTQSQLYSDGKFKDTANIYGRNMNADFGGTELWNPLKDIYKVPVTSGYGRILFVLTDGQISNENQVVDLVRQYNTSTRLFSVGIGEDVSMSLVTRMAEAGRGESEFVKNQTLSAVIIGLFNRALNG